jgi:O-antigen ligase
MGFVLNRAWTSGWLPALVGLIVILWLSAPRLGIVATIVGIILMIIQFSSVTSAVMVGDNEYSLMTRVEAWRIILEIIKVNPVLGLGPANYYFYTPLYRIMGYSLQFNSHNNYIDIIAQTGFLGLICFLWFSIETGVLALRLFIRVPDGFPKAYVYSCLGGLAGTLVAGMFGDWVLPFVYNVSLNGMRGSILAWLFLGGLVLLEQRYLRGGKDKPGAVV